MKETEVYRLGGFVVAVEENERGEKSLVMRSVAKGWRIVFDERHGLYAYWVNVVEMARERKHVRMALEATVSMLYLLSNLGVHDVTATNALVEVVDGIQNRIAEALKQVTTDKQRAEEAADDEAWMRSSEMLDEMQEEAEKAEGQPMTADENTEKHD